MSLQVWLPLTKDLRNQGLSNTTVSIMRGNETWSNDGKLGKCFYANGVNTLQINNIIPQLYNANGYSLCAWFYIEAQNTVHSGAGIISGGNWNNQVLNLSVSDWSSDHYTRLRVSGTSWNNTYTYNFYKNTWYHAVVCSDGNKTYAYINGQLIGDTVAGFLPTSIEGNNIAIGGATYYSGMQFFGKINDVRIYDHCLSPMEVKELAKGLVLHYPLNRQGWGQNNILLNTGFESRYTQSTGWDTTKNGTQMASSWGGYNSGVTNQATVYHAHLKEFNGEWVYEYIKTANESWLGISQGGLQSKLTAGKKYTFSWEQYSVSGSNYNHGGLYYYKTGASYAYFHLGSFSGTGGITGQWKKFSYTFTAPSDADYSKNMLWYIYGMNGGNGTLYMRHPKLEEGESATPWCPNSSDTLATTMSLNGTTEYDCSGFCNNGTRTGTPIYTSDTPKYVVSTQFTGTQYILSESPTTNGATLAAWVKTTSTSNQALVIDYKSGLGIGFWSSYIVPSCNSAIKTTYPNSAYHVNEWNHIVIVKNSSSSILCYVNGELQNAGSTQDYWSTGVIDGFSIAARPNGASPSTCQISDVRIYATALSADDVKSLYQNSAYIDSSGNVYGAVHSEV